MPEELPVRSRKMMATAKADSTPVVPSGAYGELADAVRAASSHDGKVTFTVRNQNDLHELKRLLSGEKHRRVAVIDANQKDRVSWKPTEVV